MSGVWVGDWGLDGQQRNRVVIVLDWAGSTLSGTINPGPEAIALKQAVADPTDWSVRLEADTVNGQGQQISWIIEGKIDDLGTYNRTIEGTWLESNQAGTFSITRQ